MGRRGATAWCTEKSDGCQGSWLIASAPWSSCKRPRRVWTGTCLILSALETLLAPRSIVLKQDSGARSLEGLEEAVVVHGEPLAHAMPLEKTACRFRPTCLKGKKDWLVL